LKIIGWNCNMAYRKKAGFILAHQPDIVIVPECEHPDKLKFEAGAEQPKDIIWFGENQDKGLGVFSYSDYRFQLLDCHNPDIKIILPIAVTDGGEDFILFATWANNPTDRKNQYIEQVWKAILEYNDLLKTDKTILMGDFNSNAIWDANHKIAGHSTVVDLLAQCGIHSLYHHHHQIKQGEELHPTFHFYRHKDKPFHIDYCFAGKYFIDRLESLEIGKYEDWAAYSDHMPVIVEFGAMGGI
jgi:exodeoxyribonuclease III